MITHSTVEANQLQYSVWKAVWEGMKYDLHKYEHSSVGVENTVLSHSIQMEWRPMCVFLKLFIFYFLAEFWNHDAVLVFKKMWKLNQENFWGAQVSEIVTEQDKLIWCFMDHYSSPVIQGKKYQHLDLAYLSNKVTSNL